jgi:uncharacterized protein (TIGR02265 family)
MIRVLGPRRGLERMTRNLRTSNNYAEARLSQTGATTWELWINRVAFPHYYRGLITCGLEHCGAKSPRVELVSHTPNAELVLLVGW